MKNQLISDVKICGLADAQSIEAAIGGGANHIGFIFFEKSPRNIQAKLAGELARDVKGQVNCVAVSVDGSDDLLDEIVRDLEPHYLQFHGVEPPQRVRQIKQRYALPIIKAFAIRQASDFAKAEPYFGIADRLLFDAKPPAGSDLPGGNGISFDWDLFAKWQAEYFANYSVPDGRYKKDVKVKIDNCTDIDKILDFTSPPMLSGGINCDNITQALAKSNAMAIDVSSGVEIAPGRKDPALITAFLKQVRDYDKSRPEKCDGILQRQ